MMIHKLFYRALLTMSFSCWLSCAALAEQTTRPDQGCDGGGEEAIRLYTIGAEYSNGMRREYDKKKAIPYFEKAIELGNGRAAIVLGDMLQDLYLETPDEQKMLKKAYTYFEKGVALGCLDGYLYLAIAAEHGWGTRKSHQDGVELLLTGADEGSCASMWGLGQLMIYEKKPEEAKVWLQRALDGGYAPAAEQLTELYRKEGNLEKEVQVLRQGARLGSEFSLLNLSALYFDGERQPKDLELADCLEKIAHTINPEVSYTELLPPMFDDLDKRCPPKPIVPYTRPTE